MANAHWVYAGSAISGERYGASLQTNIAEGLTRPELGALLSFEGVRLVVSVGDDRRAAIELMARFCHVCACWRAVQRRERALAQGFAVFA